MGVSHQPGFGLLGSVPRSLSTQPPFATQALISIYSYGGLVYRYTTAPALLLKQIQCGVRMSSISVITYDNYYNNIKLNEKCAPQCPPH